MINTTTKRMKNSLSPLFHIFFTILLSISVAYSAQGLTAKYYDNSNFTSLKSTQIDTIIDFEWGNGRPSVLTGNDNYSVTWNGYIYIPENGTYTFSYANDDEFVITVNGVEIANDTTWSVGTNNFDDATPIALTTGYYPIEVKFIEYSGGAYAKLAWRNSANIAVETIVPSANLFTELPFTCNNDDYTTDSADGCNGTIISAMDGITETTQACITGRLPNGDKDFYRFTVGTPGTLNITTSSPNSHEYHLKIGSTCDGSNFYSDATEESHSISPITLAANETVYFYLKETGWNTDEYKLNFNFTVATPGITIEDTSLAEGDVNSTTYNIPVTLDIAPSGNVSVNYATTDGTATVGDNDYNATSGTLYFNPTTLVQNIPITIQGDTVNEGAENFSIKLSNITGSAHFTNDTSIITITNDDVPPNFCNSNSLSNGFHVINPFNDINKSVEIFCYNSKDYIALPNKNDFNNFVFDDNSLSSTDYYAEATNSSDGFTAIEINAYTMEVIVNSTDRLPQKVSNFKTMGSSFSNINLIGTPFAIDWDNTQISNCDTSKLRKAYYGQAAKINTLDYASKAICNIDKMKIKLLDDYRYLHYKANEADAGVEVLERTCKLMAESVPNTWLAGEDIQGHYWIKPNQNDRTHSTTDITKASERPLVAYCWYQTDLDWAWTFLLDLDGKRTISKNDLVNKQDSCSALGLFPFVPNTEDTFERVRGFLVQNKSEWDKYTGTIQEKVNALYGNDYYLGTEKSSLIWPYGSFGVYFPTNGGNPQSWGADSNTPAWMSGSPMHNITEITTDYPRKSNDSGNVNRDYYSYGNYSSTDTNITDNSAYKYEDTMGYKGWISILGAADLNKTNKWFISRTGAGDNFDNAGNYPYYEPNGNYTGGAWLNFLFDDQGRVRHNDDWNANYPYYDYMCMADDNYDFTTRYGLVEGPFKVIEHSVAAGNELSNTRLKTKIVNDTLQFDVLLLTDDLSAIEADKNISAGIFLDTTQMVGNNEVAVDIHYFGEINDFNTATGRFEIPSSAWPSGIAKINQAYPRLFFKFKFCTRDDLLWTECWNSNLNGSALTSYAKDADSDDFALRPDKFDFSMTGSSPYIAGVDYSVTFSALDKINNPTQAYNENIPVDYDETKSGCLKGVYTPTLSTIIFNNGSLTQNLNYNEVGIVNIKMEEILGSEYAIVDASDTVDSQRLITPYDQNWTYTPNNFNVNATLKQGGNNFTYISSNLNMAVTLDINLTAVNKNNITTKNYSSACYSKQTNYNISYSPVTINPVNSLTKVLYAETTTLRNGNTNINTDVNIAAMPTTIFTDGNATIQVLLNFDRNETKIVEPFKVEIKDLNVTDTDSVSGGQNIDVNTTFYYGRSHAPDQRFAGNVGNAAIYYEIYCKSCNKTDMNITGNESIDSIDWYTNPLHTNINFGNYYDAIPTALSGTTIGATNLNTLGLSTVVLPHKDKILMNSDSWLIHSPTDFLVEFYQDGAEWAGEGQLGDTVDTNVSIRQNRRLDW